MSQDHTRLPPTRGEGQGQQSGGVPYIDYLPDNYDEVVARYPTMAQACVQCPATEGTEASRNWLTVQILAECVEARCAFFCHMTYRASEPETATHLCAAWRSAAGQSLTEASVYGSSPLINEAQPHPPRGNSHEG